MTLVIALLLNEMLPPEARFDTILIVGVWILRVLWNVVIVTGKRR